MYIQYNITLILFLYALPLWAGSLTPPAPPSSADSAMYSLQDLYERLDKGTPGEKRSGGFAGPSAGPLEPSTWMPTTDEIMQIAPAMNDNGAQPSDVAAGKTYWGLTAGGWGMQTGTKVGGGSCFIDNGDGTVTDTRTGLIWLQDANCFSVQTWDEAGSSAAGLNNGQCNLMDGSQEGDWRLPERWELQSLIDYTRYEPALPENYPFINVQSDDYWSATTHASNASLAWSVDLYSGHVNYYGKTNTHYVWPVRGGQ